MMNVVSFSGGKDSTALLLMMLEKNIAINRIICVDTTKEFPQMYEHIKAVQKICPVEIETIKIDFDYWFGEHVKTKGKRKGQKGYGWPDFRNRWCTALKRECFRQTLANVIYNNRKKGFVKLSDESVVEYHGIAYDEKHRALNNAGRKIKYPLIDWGVTEKEALEYCYEMGFNWGGLYEKFHRVSCWCCPLSRIGELRILYKDFPDLWLKLVEMDKKSFRRFRKDYSVQELADRFSFEEFNESTD